MGIERTVPDFPDFPISPDFQYSTDGGGSWGNVPNQAGYVWDARTDGVSLSPSQNLASLRVRYCVQGGWDRVEDVGYASSIIAYDVRTEGVLQNPPPAAPTNLAAATAAGGLSVALTWADNATDETSYKVQRCTGSGCTPEDLVTGLAIDSISYYDATTAPSTTYGYRSCAVNAAESTCSSTVYVSTPPAAPTGLSAAVAANGLSVVVSWTDNASNETSYKVQRCTGTGCAPVDFASALPVNSTGYTDMTTTGGSTYGYRSCAVNANGASCSTATAYVTTPLPPAVPANLRATAATDGLSVALSWSDNATNETSYTVQRCTGLNCPPADLAAGLPANSTAYNDTTTTPGTVYGYAVCAVNASGSVCATAVYVGSTSAVHYYIGDHLGSTTVIANDAGQVETESQYYPYGGERTVIADSFNNHYKFTGKERDSETGLDYFGARYYGSNMGRFMQADPLYIEARRLGDPQKLNLYAYGRNNPLKFFDPTGLEVAINCATEQDCKTAEQQINERPGTLLSVSDQDGLLTAQRTAAGPLTEQDQALLDAINDTDTQGTLNVVSGSGSVDFGINNLDANGNHTGSNTVDVADTAKLSQAGLSPGNAVAHEALEAYSIAGGASFSDAHKNNAFPGFFLTARPSTTAQGRTYTVRLGVDGPTYQYTTTFRTPIPPQTFTAPTPDLMRQAREIIQTQSDVSKVEAK